MPPILLSCATRCGDEVMAPCSRSRTDARAPRREARPEAAMGMRSASPVPLGSRYCCFAYAGEGPKSTAMHGSSPTTQASCPGSIRATSPGPISTSVPSSIATPIRPDRAYRKCPRERFCFRVKAGARSRCARAILPFLCEPMGFRSGACGAQLQPGHLEAHSTGTAGRQ
jgi:hypothetical protein